MSKKLLNLFLLLLLPFIVFVHCQFESSGAIGRSIRLHGSIDEFADVKTYSNVTLKDEFAADRIVVVLNKEASLNFNTYTPEDFPEIKVTDVFDSTRLTMEIVRKQLEAEYGNTCENFGGIDRIFLRLFHFFVA